MKELSRFRGFLTLSVKIYARKIFQNWSSSKVNVPKIYQNWLSAKVYERKNKKLAMHGSLCPRDNKVFQFSNFHQILKL